jgi:hypothetical protein
MVDRIIKGEKVLGDAVAFKRNIAGVNVEIVDKGFNEKKAREFVATVSRGFLSYDFVFNVDHEVPMDDFEKDALEGFSMHSTPEKAKALIKEMNASISEKVADEKGVQKSRIIWFSAAASIVLIVMISIFFFNKSKNETSSYSKEPRR